MLFCRASNRLALVATKLSGLGRRFGRWIGATEVSSRACNGLLTSFALAVYSAGHEARPPAGSEAAHQRGPGGPIGGSGRRALGPAGHRCHPRCRGRGLFLGLWGWIYELGRRPFHRRQSAFPRVHRRLCLGGVDAGSVSGLPPAAFAFVSAGSATLAALASRLSRAERWLVRAGADARLLAGATNRIPIKAGTT